MITTTPVWPLSEVFVTDDIIDHKCCSCCAGYCPRTEGDWSTSVTSYHGHGFCRVGQDYVSDYYVAIRADLIALPEDLDLIDGPSTLPKAMIIPDVKPAAESASLLTPHLAGELLDCGIEILHSDEGPQHLYYLDEHVGWIMAAKEGFTLNQIRLMQDAAANRALQDLLNLPQGPILEKISSLVGNSAHLQRAIDGLRAVQA